MLMAVNGRLDVSRPDGQLATCGATFGAGSGRRTTVRLYFERDSHAPWRGRGCGLAAEVTRACRARQVVDLGCRDGRELVSAFQASGVETIGADFPHYIQIAERCFA